MISAKVKVGVRADNGVSVLNPKTQTLNPKVRFLAIQGGDCRGDGPEAEGREESSTHGKGCPDNEPRCPEPPVDSGNLVPFPGLHRLASPSALNLNVTPTPKTLI